MEPDGNNKTLIYEGMVNANSLQQEDDWLYFSLMTDSRIPIEEQKDYWRFHMKTGELESFLPYERTETLVMFSSFVVAGKYFYTIAEKDGKRGILSYRLDSGEKQFCEKLNMEEVGGIGIKSLMLEECGDYLVLLYLDYLGAGNTASMYVTKKGEAISEETEWKEIRFPDMLERTASPPTPLPRTGASYPMIDTNTNNSYTGYAFRDGFVYYLNTDWKLCSRPLFGEPGEVTVYEETTLPVDEENRFWDMSCSLSFGKDCFYYRYYTEIIPDSAVNHAGYHPCPAAWGGYIGKLPEKKK